VAGMEVLEAERGAGVGGWIRPVSARPTTELTQIECKCQNDETPRLLDILDVPLLRPAPQLHQTENHLIDDTRSWLKVGEFPRDSVSQLCDLPRSLWTNSCSTGAGSFDCISQREAAPEHHSLMLIRPDDFTVRIDTIDRHKAGRSYRGNFTYKENYYSLKLTDPVARSAYAKHPDGDYRVRDAYLCVSLTMPFLEEGRCYKLVAAVIGRQGF
jgi:hypothetical protein